MRNIRFVYTLALGILSALSAVPAAAVTYVGSVIASGLDNPRGLAFGPDGALYIAEGGSLAASGPTTVVNGAVARFGLTGAITKVSGGTQTRIVTGLPSLVAIATGETTGPQDIAFGADGTGYVLIGLGTNPNARSTDLASAPAALNLGRVLTFTGASPASFADVSAFEATNNPVGGPLDSNPFHIVASGTGLLVNDAGANDLIAIAANGSTSLVAGFPGRDIGGGFPSDSVPTGVAVGPDGSIYVAELTGFPFTPGAARIYKIPPAGSPAVFATGFTNITDIAFGADGALYVLEIDNNGLTNPGGTGALIRLNADGSQETIYTQGLVTPTGLAVGPDGAFYVTNFSAAAGIGQVVRIAAVPEPATWALMSVGMGAVGVVVRRRRSSDGATPGSATMHVANPIAA